MTRPVLYSFRRCPYAIRGRLALYSAGIETELREIVLRDKAPEFVHVSPKATVPVIVHGAGVIEESREIMIWALSQADPEKWTDMPRIGGHLIDENDQGFKSALDRTKYHTRYGSDPEDERKEAMRFIVTISEAMAGQPWLFGARAKLADMAILPFVRQFANIDRPRFDNDAPENIRTWLDRFLEDPRFLGIMKKYPKWTNGDPVTLFPDPGRIHAS